MTEKLLNVDNLKEVLASVTGKAAIANCTPVFIHDIESGSPLARGIWIAQYRDYVIVQEFCAATRKEAQQAIQENLEWLIKPEDGLVTARLTRQYLERHCL